MVKALFVALLQLTIIVYVAIHGTLHHMVRYRDHYILVLYLTTFFVPKSLTRQEWRHLAHALHAIAIMDGSSTQFVVYAHCHVTKSTNLAFCNITMKLLSIVILFVQRCTSPDWSNCLMISIGLVDDKIVLIGSYQVVLIKSRFQCVPRANF